MIRLSVLLRNIISEDPAYYVLQIKIDRSEVGYSTEITQGVVKKEFSTDCMFRSNVHCYEYGFQNNSYAYDVYSFCF